MNPVSQIVKHKNPTFGVGEIIDYDFSTDPDRHKIIVRFESADLKMQYPEAFEGFLICNDPEFQAEVEKLIALKKQLKAEKERKEAAHFSSINHKPVNTGRETRYSSYPYGWSKTNKNEKRVCDLEKNFSAVRKVLNNASYDLKLPEVEQTAPADKASYIPKQYDNQWDQACYVLRYSYAYAYEYYLLYTKILRAFKDKGHLRVCSIGCGPMTDAWSLEAASASGCNSKIEYTGIDLAEEWEEGYRPIIKDVNVKHPLFGTSAGKYLMSCDSIDFDIIVFPKSLRDIYYNNTDADYYRIKNAFEAKPFTKKTVCIAFSLTNNPGEKEDGKKSNDELLQQDYERIDELIECLKKQGFAIKGDPIRNPLSDYRVFDNTGYPEIDERLKNDAYDLTERYMMMNRRYQRFIAYIMEKEG